MRKSFSLLLALALTGGLMAAAFTTSAQAGGGSLNQSVDTANFKDGKFVGKVSADRRLCLNRKSVVIYKVPARIPRYEIAKAVLNFDNWSDTGQATFSVRHPAMKIERRKARMNALAGDYVVELPYSLPFIYGKDFSCQTATRKLNI